jgi:hypothetical protein
MQDCFHQLKDPNGSCAIGLYPVDEVFPELCVEHGISFEEHAQNGLAAAASACVFLSDLVPRLRGLCAFKELAISSALNPSQAMAMI